MKILLKTLYLEFYTFFYKKESTSLSICSLFIISGSEVLKNVKNVKNVEIVGVKRIEEVLETMLIPR
jgi:hypothetical protein